MGVAVPGGGETARAAREPNGHIDATLAALADPVRRRVVEHLSAGPCRAGELAEVLDVSPPTMSKHLRALRKSGLVAEQASPLDARVRIYSLSSGPMRELRAWIDRAEQGWAAQLTAFAEHLAGEQPHGRAGTGDES